MIKRNMSWIDEVSVDALVPASDGISMRQFIEWIKNYSTLVPKNVFDIGANMGQDAEALRDGFGLDPGAVWTFEPHPLLDRFIKSRYQFHQYDYAVSNISGAVDINVIDPRKNTNSGISSVRKHLGVPEDNFIKVTVPCIRMDNFMNDHGIEAIDFLKLDVEGLNYEVLEGFGDKIKSVNAIHIESEHEESWEGEMLWSDFKELLEPHFELVFFQRYFTQSDSFWVKKEYLRGEPS